MLMLISIKDFGYGIRFDTHGNILLLNGSGFIRNVIPFGDDMSSSVHIDSSQKFCFYSW